MGWGQSLRCNLTHYHFVLHEASSCAPWVTRVNSSQMQIASSTMWRPSGQATTNITNGAA
jgi:hypothetical protein